VVYTPREVYTLRYTHPEVYTASLLHPVVYTASLLPLGYTRVCDTGGIPGYVTPVGYRVLPTHHGAYLPTTVYTHPAHPGYTMVLMLTPLYPSLLTVVLSRV